MLRCHDTFAPSKGRNNADTGCAYLRPGKCSSLSCVTSRVAFRWVTTLILALEGNFQQVRSWCRKGDRLWEQKQSSKGILVPLPHPRPRHHRLDYKSTEPRHRQCQNQSYVHTQVKYRDNKRMAAEREQRNYNRARRQHSRTGTGDPATTRGVTVRTHPRGQGSARPHDRKTASETTVLDGRRHGCIVHVSETLTADIPVLPFVSHL